MIFGESAGAASVSVRCPPTPPLLHEGAVVASPPLRATRNNSGRNAIGRFGRRSMQRRKR
jgi:hypothetical protein